LAGRQARPISGRPVGGNGRMQPGPCRPTKRRSR
jgi:hypothetical protein